MDVLAPPPPPDGAFDARIKVDGTSYFEKYLDNALTEKTFNFEYVAATGNGPITFSWDTNLAETVATITVTDTFGGTIFNEDISTYEGSFTPSEASPLLASGFVMKLTPTGNDPPVDDNMAATPVFDPAGGTFTGSVNVTISTSTADASIYYTTDGSTPDTGSAEYTGAITITETTTLKAIATADGFTDSEVAEATYTIEPEGPQGPAFSIPFYVTDGVNDINLTVGVDPNGQTSFVQGLDDLAPPPPPDGAFDARIKVEDVSYFTKYQNNELTEKTFNFEYVAATGNGPITFSWDTNLAETVANITITDTFGGATYSEDLSTFNGSFTPSEASPLLASGFVMKLTPTGEEPPTENPVAEKPVFDPEGGVYLDMVTVTISTGTTEADIYYTTDGSIPTTSSNVYSTPLEFMETTTLKAIAVAEGFQNSEVSTANYVISESPIADAPVFTPSPGIYLDQVEVSITSTTPAAVIYYTLNGETPDETSDIYESPVTVTETTTFKAIAVADDYQDSDVTEATYTIVTDQLAFSVMFNVSDGSNDIDLTIGVDPEGQTDFVEGLDILAPPAPPDGAFDGRIKVGGVSYFKKYLENTISEKIFNFEYVAASGNGPIEFTWNNDGLSDLGTFTVQDTFGGTIFSEDLTSFNGSFIPSTASPLLADGFVLKVLPNEFEPTPVAEAPVFDPQGGTYTNQVTVSMSSQTDTATIYYTTDGSTPTAQSSEYIAPLIFTETTTLKAIAIADGFLNSEISEATYSISTEELAFSVIFNVSDGFNNIDLTIGIDPNGQIDFVDGLDQLAPPAPPDGAFDGRIKVGGVSYFKKFLDNSISEKTFNFEYDAATGNGPIVFTWDNTGLGNLGTFTVQDTFGGTIFSEDLTSFNGSFIPSTASPLLADGFVLKVLPNEFEPTPVAEAPVFDPQGGTYTNQVTVSMSSQTDTATIYYTTDGSTPTAQSSEYIAPLIFTETTTLKAIAIADGFTNSTVAEAEYIITDDEVSFAVAFDLTDGLNSRTLTIGVDPDGTNAFNDDLDQLAGPEPPDGEFDARIIVSGEDYVTKFLNNELTEKSFIFRFNASNGNEPIVFNWDENLSELGVFNVLDLFGGNIITIDLTTFNGEFIPANESVFLDEGFILKLTPYSNEPFADQPVFTPPSGTYIDEVTVSMSTITPNSTIYYTTDGSVPNIQSLVYDSPINITETTTLRAVAVAEGYQNSKITTAIYKIIDPPASEPVFSPNPGTYSNEVEVSLTTSTPDAVIHYTLDGSTPGSGSLVFETPILLTETTAVKAITIAEGFSNSQVVTGNYTIVDLPVASSPVFSPSSGTYLNQVEVAIESATSSATIFYTLDGTQPTNTSEVYTEPFLLTETTTVKAIAVADGFVDSDISESLYTLLSDELSFSVLFNFDDGVNNIDLTFGVDPNGQIDFVDGLDQLAPPAPPDGAFDARIKVGGISYFKKYLDNTITEKIFNFEYSASAGNGPVVVTWDNTELSELGVFTIQDTFGGSIFSEDLTSFDGSFTPSTASPLLAGGFVLKVLPNETAPPSIAEAPDFDPAGGTYMDQVIVSISSQTETATIYYTTDGTEPTTQSNVYVNPVVVQETTTLKAIAIADGFINSNISEAIYTIVGEPVASAPVFIPPSTAFDDSLNISITSETLDATIFYTTDESIPDTTSLVYSGTVTITRSTTFKAIAVADNMLPSSVSEAVYTKNATPAVIPVFDPSGGTFVDSVTVTISSSTPGSSIYYTLDGNDPDTTSSVYTQPLKIEQTSTLKAIAIADGFLASDVAEEVYTIVVTPTLSAPTFTPDGGSFADSVEVTITAENENAAIYYTTDGSDPTNESFLFVSAISIYETTTLKAIAVLDEFNDSDITTAVYTITSAPIAFEPVFSPSSGSYLNEVEITIETSTENATIYYTFDSTDPTTSSEEYMGPILITETTTIKAVAVADGFINSNIAEATYNILTGELAFSVMFNVSDGSNNIDLTIGVDPDGQVDFVDGLDQLAPPAPPDGAFDGRIKVGGVSYFKKFLDNSISEKTFNFEYDAATGNGPIVFTWDNTGLGDLGTFTVQDTFGGAIFSEDLTSYEGSFTPSTASPLLAGGFVLKVLPNEAEPPAAADTPDFDPAGGTYTDQVTVTISTQTATATIYYTTDGTEPTAQSTEYTTPVTLTETTTLKAIAIADGFLNSEVSEATFTIVDVPVAEAPVFDPEAGTYTNQVDVSITSTTSGATIYYTTDGADPDENSTEYTGAVSITESTTLKAIAIASGFQNSNIAEAAYTIVYTPGPVTLTSPENEATDVNQMPTFEWTASTNAQTYTLQVSASADFSSTVIDVMDLEGISYTTETMLDPMTEHYWRVRGENAQGVGEWSDTYTFTTEMGTSIEDPNLPVVYALNQNYPNPFNPSTQIQYQLPEASKVKIEVFNMLGQQISVLVNAQQSTGVYEISFDASDLTTGVYLLRMTANDFVETRKMMLLK